MINQYENTTYFPATCASSTKANTASSAFSRAFSFVSITNFFISPRYLLNSGLLSESCVRNNFTHSSYPVIRAFHA